MTSGFISSPKALFIYLFIYLNGDGALKIEKMFFCSHVKDESSRSELLWNAEYESADKIIIWISVICPFCPSPHWLESVLVWADDRKADSEHDPAGPPGDSTPIKSEISMSAFPLRLGVL